MCLPCKQLLINGNKWTSQMQEDFRVQTRLENFSPWSCDVCYVGQFFFIKHWSFCIQEVKCENVFRCLSFNFVLQTRIWLMYSVNNITFFKIVALNYQSEGRMLQLNRAKFSANGNCGYVLKPNCMCQGKKTSKINGLLIAWEERMWILIIVCLKMCFWC